MSLRHRLKAIMPRRNPVAQFRKAPENLGLDFEILAFEQGLLASMKSFLPVDGKGQAIPWFTYPAIEYLNQFDFTGLKVFEYGCGQSTRYWARRGASVWSVDHDEAWYRKMSTDGAPGQTLYFGGDRDSYVGAIEKPQHHFDVVLIDGVHREDCVVPAVAHLAPGGFIILDNADRDTRAGQMLRERGFFEVDFNGFGPINGYTWTTALFLPPSGFVLPVTFRPPRPIGGLPPDDA